LNAPTYSTPSATSASAISPTVHAGGYSDITSASATARTRLDSGLLRALLFALTGKVDRLLDEKSRFVAVRDAHRDIEKARWRANTQLAPGGSQKARVTMDALTVSAAVAPADR
jgi:predicted component of type VI protein secretion system